MKKTFFFSEFVTHFILQFFFSLLVFPFVLFEEGPLLVIKRCVLSTIFLSCFGAYSWVQVQMMMKSRVRSFLCKRFIGTSLSDQHFLGCLMNSLKSPTVYLNVYFFGFRKLTLVSNLLIQISLSLSLFVASSFISTRKL
ncbi:hypothetical protein BDB00DRAFT_169520 [Zychaea mexicana]|uniref:uncharacterized protein n=1 Tax=Zychaea mexicana TaxID=64656 RepID=UPI0022FF3E22|nr:uncharacterized protein BDB00DRAFT_169520 [Zychaea mexicana]KAI9482531.1 hypothetical protein BDB00DRAFT_169520 [Zychaea mexicana]